MRAVLAEEDVVKIRVHVATLQAEVARLRTENARMREMATGLTWCAQCGALCERIGRWRKFCSTECRRLAYNATRRARYSQARDLGMPGREAARFRQGAA